MSRKIQHRNTISYEGICQGGWHGSNSSAPTSLRLFKCAFYVAMNFYFIPPKGIETNRFYRVYTTSHRDPQWYLKTSIFCIENSISRDFPPPGNVLLIQSTQLGFNFRNCEISLILTSLLRKALKMTQIASRKDSASLFPKNIFAPFEKIKIISVKTAHVCVKCFSTKVHRTKSRFEKQYNVGGAEWQKEHATPIFTTAKRLHMECQRRFYSTQKNH